MSIRRRPGVCPLCRGRVAVPRTMEGTWTGAKANGRPAGGGVFSTRCRRCRTGLIAFDDVYDDGGQVIPSQHAGDPDLVWSLRGSPWQTIALSLLIAGVAAWLVLHGMRR